jgi:hypothetical protein
MLILMGLMSVAYTVLTLAFWRLGVFGPPRHRHHH